MSDIDWLRTSRDLLIGLAGKCMWCLFADWSRIGVVSVISAWSLLALCMGKCWGVGNDGIDVVFGNCGPITCKRNVQLLNLLHSPFPNHWPSRSITPQSLNESKTVLQKQKFIQKVHKWGGVKAIKTSIITYIITDYLSLHTQGYERGPCVGVIRECTYKYNSTVWHKTKTIYLRRARSLLNFASCRSFFLRLVSKTIASATVSLPFRYRAQSLALASSVLGASPSLSTSPLRRRNRWISLGARVQRSLCMQAKFPPLNTSTRYSSVEVRRAWSASLWILYGPLSKRSSWINRTKGSQGRMGLTSVWYFLISPRADRAWGLDFRRDFTSSIGSLKCWWGHLAAAVGGLGLPFLGTNVAIAFLASRMGGWLVCPVVSKITLPVGAVEVVGRSCLSSGLAAPDVAPSVGAVGGLACKSSTISATSSIVRVEPRCASFNRFTVFSSAGGGGSG